MKHQIVNSTILDTLLGQVAPYHCISCDKIGDALCQYCIFDIDSISISRCPLCHEILVRDCCSRCTTYYDKLLTIGECEDVIKKLLHLYKFTPSRGIATSIVGLLDMYLPHFPKDCRIVPLPSSTDRIRLRGFDHARLLAKLFAARRGNIYSDVLVRTKNIRQLGKSHDERLAQTEELFTCRRELSATHTYIIMDDIVTTSATLNAAARSLRENGATAIVACAAAHQHWS